MEEIKTEIKALADELREIQKNHLPHIYKALVKLNTNQRWLIAIVLAILGGIIAYYFK